MLYLALWWSSQGLCVYMLVKKRSLRVIMGLWSKGLWQVNHFKMIVVMAAESNSDLCSHCEQFWNLFINLYQVKSWSFLLLKVVTKGQKKKEEKAPVMDRISTNKQGVRKQIRRLQAHNPSRKNKATVKDKRIRNALGEYLNPFNCWMWTEIHAHGGKKEWA